MTQAGGRTTMRKIGVMAALFMLLIPLSARAQEANAAPMLKRLSDKASKTVDVNLDQSMLRFASAFLDPKDPDQARAKRIIANMKGIYVHHFEFDKSGEYSEEDLATLRAQLREPDWSRIIDARSKHDSENVEVYFHRDGDKFGGLVVIATEPTELTYVNIIGPITPEDLRELGGQFGIPRVDVNGNSPEKKEKEK